MHIWVSSWCKFVLLTMKIALTLIFFAVSANANPLPNNRGWGKLIINSFNLIVFLIFYSSLVNNAIEDFTNSGVGQLCFACRLADNLINGGHRG